MDSLLQVTQQVSQREGRTGIWLQWVSTGRFSEGLKLWKGGKLRGEVQPFPAKPGQ